MKNLILFILFSFAIAKNIKTTILDTITVSTYVKPDTYFLPIVVSYISKNPEDVLEILGKLDLAVKKLKLKYKGGNFYIRKEKEFDTKTKRFIFKGYKGEIKYSYYLKNIKNQNKIFKILNNFSKLYNISYTVYNPYYLVSNRKQNLVLKRLKYKAIKEAISEKHKIEKIINKICEITYLDFIPFYLPIFNFPLIKSSFGSITKNIPAPEPTKDLKEISLKVRVKFKCFKQN